MAILGDLRPGPTIANARHRHRHRPEQTLLYRIVEDNYPALVAQMACEAGAASMGSAAVLAISASLLARASKGLLIGEPAHPKLRESLLEIAANDPSVRQVAGMLTVQTGPHTVVAALSALFEDELTTPQIAQRINGIKKSVKSRHVQLTYAVRQAAGRRNLAGAPARHRAGKFAAEVRPT